MPLSKLTTDQIRKEAEDAYPIHHTETISKESLREFQSYHYAKRQGYEAGATAWAIWKEKAEWYMATLDKIANGYVGYSSASQMAKEALKLPTHATP